MLPVDQQAKNVEQEHKKLLDKNLEDYDLYEIK